MDLWTYIITAYARGLLRGKQCTCMDNELDKLVSEASLRDSEVEWSLATFEPNSYSCLVPLTLTFVTSTTCLSFARAWTTAYSYGLWGEREEGEGG